MKPLEPIEMWRLAVGAATDTGRVRARNEDRFLVDADLALLLVADGVGGNRAGDVASRLAVEAAHGCAAAAVAKPAALPDPEELLLKALLAAHQSVMDDARQHHERMGMSTTLVMAWLPPPGEQLWVAHVGDSRAYLWHAGQLTRLTEDHTVLNQARRAGLLSPDPAEWPPRSALSQALGSREMIAPDVGHFPIESGDRILLCTDGLTSPVTDDELNDHLSSASAPQAICEALIQVANARGGEDNITAVVAQVGTPRQSLVTLLAATRVSGRQ